MLGACASLDEVNAIHAHNFGRDVVPTSDPIRYKEVRDKDSAIVRTEIRLVRLSKRLDWNGRLDVPMYSLELSQTYSEAHQMSLSQIPREQERATPPSNP